MWFPRLAGIAVLTMALFVGCGGSPAAPTAGPTTPGSAPTTTPGPTEPTGTATAPVGDSVDVCSLLSAADLNAATGEDYVEGVLDAYGLGLCSWNVEGATGNTGSLVVGEIQTQTLSFIKSAFGSGGVDVTVAGHAAFYNPSEGLQSLWVDVGGGQLFVLSFPRSGDLDSTYQAIALQLAEIAVGNI